MVIARAMSREDKDDHEQDVVMPGFRFHPTEEELVEFYLRRKVEGKSFNVELITFLDLYRFDPWELPALATIGEREWFFYVPRDRKYRNGDRPNRVTTSGYWKATGADRMIRTESFKSIGLKKTLVFYYGKAPKGIRTSWIMNEYRLPQQETDQYQKAVISLCRVYKRAGVEEHSSLPTTVFSKPSSSKRTDTNRASNTGHPVTPTSPALRLRSPSMEIEMLHQVGTSSSSEAGSMLGTQKSKAAVGTRPSAMLEDGETELQTQPNQTCSPSTNCVFFPCSTVSTKPVNAVDELHKLIDFQQLFEVHYHSDVQYLPLSSTQTEPLPFHLLPNHSVHSVQSVQASFQDKLWQWNTIPEANRDFTDFK
ncbi:NAC domain-containing protein 35-like [Aristolochia californica]|uniref:NAC domain-containing protein 35-like n=1 Tax=Aristolochia californica TaxID=171875 RepID=UPI0035E27A19